MTKAVVFGLALLLAAFMSRSYVTPISAKDLDWRYEECRFQSLQRGLWTPQEETLTAVCATQKWNVPGGLAEFSAIASCESGWNRFASNGGRYVGLFQHAASAYVGRIRQYEPSSWDRKLSERWQNSRGQIVMSARMMHQLGTSPWSCA